MDIKAILRIKRTLNGFDKFVLVLNGIAVLALLLSYLAPVTDPRKCWLIAILGLGYQVILPAHFVFLLYWLVRSKPYMLISGITLIAGLGIFFKYWEFHLPNQPDKKSGMATIRVMTYNVHDFMSPLNIQSTRNEIANLVNTKQPDILAIQEYTDNTSDYKATNAALTNAMQARNHYFKAFDATLLDSTGIAIYTKYPQINQGTLISTCVDTSGIQAIFVDVKYHNKTFRIYTTHLQPTHFDTPEHEYLHNLPHTGKVDLHEWKLICNKLKAAFIKRSTQVTLIKKHIAKCPYPYLIIGDFNDTPISYAVNELGRGLKNGFFEKGSGFGITYYGDFPHLQIDYILASRQFNILNYQVIRKKTSDHYPVISDMSLN